MGAVCTTLFFLVVNPKYRYVNFGTPSTALNKNCHIMCLIPVQITRKILTHIFFSTDGVVGGGITSRLPDEE